jgi:hypothetical protein
VKPGDAYEFVFRGQLAEQALDSAGRQRRAVGGHNYPNLASALNFDLLDERFLGSATEMGTVYTALVAFENGVRSFVTKVLVDDAGENWWTDRVQPGIQEFSQSRRDDDEQNKWHGTRADDPINYTEMKHLVKIIVNNWESFKAFIPRQHWVESIFMQIERSRNVIMHGGILEVEDVERLGINMRDWIKQVGA